MKPRAMTILAAITTAAVAAVVTPPPPAGPEFVAIRNPVLPGADPHAAILQGRVWIYPTYGWRGGPSFQTWSSRDLRRWQPHGVVLRFADVRWITDDGSGGYSAWAPCIAAKNGRYYFYYSVGPQRPRFPARIGVAVGDSPAGPFRDSGKPLLTGGNGFEAIDPMVFTDPKTGASYLYAGGSAGSKLRIFELTPDMVNLAREIPVETPPNFTEGAFVHERNGVYYLSYSSGWWQGASYSAHYATSGTPVGPWTYRGVILSSDDTHKGPGHHSIIKHPAKDEWYIVYHRWNNQQGDGPYRGGRETAIERLYYTTDGLIKPVKMTDAAPYAPMFGPGSRWDAVPGTVINHLPASSGRYIGSPSLAVLPNGQYVATHDEFGPGSTETSVGVTRVFRSADRGRTWKPVSTLKGAFWSGLFVHRGALYLFGTTKQYGHVVIRRSKDGGTTWTTPKDRNTGLLRTDGRFHTAPVPVLVHNGRLWRAVEDAKGTGGWGRHFRAFVMSAPVGADLLKASSWTSTNPLPGDAKWLDGRFGGWLEGNAVATPEGGIADILRVDVPEHMEQAATVRVSGDGRTASFDPATGFTHLPGGAKKFTIRFDPVSRLWWTLSDEVPEKHRNIRPAAARNNLALVSSADLKQWDWRCTVLYHPDPDKHAFQYVDWQFDGNDLIAVSRTAYDDGLGGARNYHDANFLTFHRIPNFRSLDWQDSVPMPDGRRRRG